MLTRTGLVTIALIGSVMALACGGTASREPTSIVTRVGAGKTPVDAGYAGFYTQNATLLRDPLVTGQFVATLDWRDLEPAPGVYEFSKLDGALGLASGAGKRVRLKIGAGADSPNWIREPPYDVPFYTVSGPEGGAYDAPYVWDPMYVRRLNDFLAALGEHLSSPGFEYLSTIGGVYVPSGPNFTEMITPGGPSSFRAATSSSPAYRQGVYAAAIRSEIETMVGTFPANVTIIVNLSQTWDEARSGDLDDKVARDVGDYTTGKYAGRIELQNASVPATFATLIPYLRAKAEAGVAVSVQIRWSSLTDGNSDGGRTVTANELCGAYRFAYDLGARAIEVNDAAFSGQALRAVTESWNVAFKGMGPKPTCS